MSNIIYFSSLFGPNLSQLDRTDPRDVESATSKLKETCFEIARLTQQLKDPHPHCPKNITKHIAECAACQRGEFGHVSDLIAYRKSLRQHIRGLKKERDQCRHFLTP